MRFLTNPTLQQRIGFLVALGLTAGLGLFSWLGIQSMNDSTRRILDERLTIARIVASHVDETLSHTLVLVQNTASDGWEPVEADFRQRARKLASLLAQSGIIPERVFLVDAGGKILAGEPDLPEALGFILPGYDDMAASLSQGLPQVSGLAYAPITALPVVFASAPIYNSAGRVEGALSVAVDVKQSSISGFIKPITVGNTGYTEIIDKKGVVMARTDPGQPPLAFERSDHPGRFAQLMAEGKATVRTCHRCHGSETQPQRRRDVLAFAPLSSAPWGIALRQSEEEAFSLTKQLQRRLLILGGMIVVGVFLLIWVMMQGVVRPIKVLTDASRRVAAGDFKGVVPLRRRDEIGQLSNAFAAMTSDLARAQNELVARNQELLALNSIANTVGQSLDLEEVLTKAMQKVLEVTGTEAGCVFLCDAENKRLKLVSQVGSSRLFSCEQARTEGAGCACQQGVLRGHTMLVNDVSQCPMLGEKTRNGKDGLCFIIVPLKSKERTLGVMNVAWSHDRYFTENEFRLLDSIGRQVGLAVENSMLYQEAKQKEEVRGQLLNAIITAQEDERKRISREIHDQAGQALTAVIMGLEAAESMSKPTEGLLRQKLANTRHISANLLEDMRKLMQDLRSTVLDDLGLVAAIRYYAQNRLEAAGVSVDFEAEGLGRRLVPSVETALFRISQEAIQNIVKHAGAHTAKIRLKAEDGKVGLLVEDDGRGFDVNAFFYSDGTRRSLGLVSMQERATLLGGTFCINSSQGQGTKVMVEVPLTFATG